MHRSTGLRAPRRGRRDSVLAGATALLMLLVAWTAGTVASAAEGTDPDRSVVFVVDTSGSMGGTPLEQAKQALTQAVQDLDPSIAAGLRTFAGSCGDGGNLLVPVALDNRDALQSAAQSLVAGGGTPTPDALRAAVNDLPATGERTIVLISDGQSGCGDPCLVAKDLRAQGIDFTVHAVGFNATSNAETELKCIADATGGQYFSATDASGLASAIGTAVGGDRCQDAYLVTLRGSGQTYGESTEMAKITEGIMQTLPDGVLPREIEIDYAALGTETLKEGIDTKLPEMPPSVPTTGAAGFRIAQLTAWANEQRHQLVEVNLPKFLDSARGGQNKLEATLLSIKLECRLSPKNPKVFIAGYSQGALAIHELLVGLSKSDVNNYGDMIARVALIADPERAPRSNVLALYSTAPFSTKSFGACHVLEALPGDLTCGSSLTGPAQDVPAQFISRTASICYAHDIVCDTSSIVTDHGYNLPARIRLGVIEHTMYKYGDNLVNMGRWLGQGF